MSVILFFGTCIISIILKDFKNALFFPSKVSVSIFPTRSWISYFSLKICFFIGSSIDQRLCSNHCHFLNDPFGLLFRHSNTKTWCSLWLQTNTQHTRLVDLSIHKQFWVVDSCILSSATRCHSHFHGPTNHGCHCQSQRKQIEKGLWLSFGLVCARISHSNLFHIRFAMVCYHT